jgi:integrase
VLNATLNVAVNRRYIATNPAATTKLPKRITNPERMTFLTPEEVRQLAEAMPAHYKTATYVAAYMGLRAGELWALRRKDVDLLTGTLHVRQALKEINGAPTSTEHIQAHERGLIFGPPKSQASRRSLALPAPIRTLLTEHLASFLPGGASADALIFTTPGGNPVRHGLFYRRVFRPAVKRALPPSKHALRWHDLRHTAASLSLAVSPNLHLVKERLGHEDIRTTINTYGHLLPSVEAALADGLGALFAAAETPPTATPSATNVVPLNQRA